MTSTPRHAPSDPLTAAYDQVKESLNTRTDFVLGTSGSTGCPRRVALSAAALRASAVATHARLGGPGRWLLALPTDHVAGLQVLVRSVLCGHRPLEVDRSGGFRPASFTAATRQLRTSSPATRCYVSLVPTQLRRVLGDAAGRIALASYDAVLVGGAASNPRLLQDARAAGARVVTTYGMTETAGGCVYDGVPLEGVEARVASDGRVLLRGPVLARGYLAPDGTLDEAATKQATVSGGWWRTNDAGRIVAGRLEVLGRLDDVIVTGGVKVAPTRIEAEIDAWLADVGGGDSLVVGVPDPEWGERVVALVHALDPERWRVQGGSVFPTALRQRIATMLGREWVPHDWLSIEELPHRDSGKPDRRAARELAAARLRIPPTAGLNGRPGPTPTRQDEE